jgi:hypothetical protein
VIDIDCCHRRDRAKAQAPSTVADQSAEAISTSLPSAVAVIIGGKNSHGCIASAHLVDF